MKTLRKYKMKTYLGKHNGEFIYLTAPSWDCGWYWGFGYIGNSKRHYHLDGLGKDKDLYDGIKEHFGDSLVISDRDLPKFVELIETFYALKQTAEVLGRGGSHYTTNPCSDLIKNPDEVARINNVVLPAIFDEVYKILESN